MELKPGLLSINGQDAWLLIVPYGIETTESGAAVEGHGLLIVPYGIETKYSDLTPAQYLPFNRTLWN